MTIRIIMQEFGNVTSDDDSMTLFVRAFLVDGSDVYPISTEAVIQNGQTLSQGKDAIAAALRAQALTDYNLVVPANNVVLLDYVLR